MPAMFASCIAVSLCLVLLSNAVFCGHTHVPQRPPNDGGERIVFPGDFHRYHVHETGFSRGGRYEVSSNDSLQVPLDFAMQINEYNMTDLLDKFVEGQDGPSILSRFADDEGNERNAATMPKAAGCMPELKTEKIVNSDDPSVLYIPQCTRVERCGGCCSHTLLSCQPKETETITYQVIKTQYTGGKKLKYLGKELVLVERHTKCKCDCKIKPEDCNRYQEYRKSECRCTCTNTDEEKKCYKNNEKKLWNPELCACQCRDISMCSTGYQFDTNECRCVPEPIKRRFATFEPRITYTPDDVPDDMGLDYTSK